MLGLAVNKLSRRAVRYIDIHGFCAAQQARINHVKLVKRAVAFLVVSGDCRVLVGGGNFGIEVGHFVKITAQSDYVLVIVVKSQRPSGRVGRL